MQSEDNNELMSLIGKSLGQYRVVERLGAGGMSTVFKAYQPTLDRYVAVKVLSLSNVPDSVFLQRFTREAQVLAKLTHPNIVQVYDFGEQDTLFYIVMEYVDGGTLEALLRQGALSVPEAADFVIQAASGLEYAHLQGIVHRDVKPANMLLRKDGHLLLSDFGIARILAGATELTTTTVMIGTPLYMSPEQANGHPIDVRTDIYSLGIVLFHFLTGRAPFASDSPITIVVKHLQEALPVEYLRSMNIPASIEQVVVKMTAKDPAKRYASAQEVIDALTEALAAAHLSLPRTRSGEHLQGKTVSTAIPVNQQGPSPELLLDPTTYPESLEKTGETEHPSQPLQESPTPSTVLFTDATLSHVDLKDFFILYNRIDRAWAKWIAWELDNAGYSAVLPAWSFQSESDFELEMQKAAAKAHHTIVILSPDYLNAFRDHSADVLRFREEVTNKQNKLLPIYVRECGKASSLLLHQYFLETRSKTLSILSQVSQIDSWRKDALEQRIQMTQHMYLCLTRHILCLGSKSSFLIRIKTKSCEVN
jgi:serine/threonine protein kinase